jgi:hypothetical protein
MTFPDSALGRLGDLRTRRVRAIPNEVHRVTGNSGPFSKGGEPMAMVLDPDTLDRLRKMSPREAYDEVKRTLYGMGAGGSDEFLDACETLVEEGILTWDRIEEFES